MQNIIFLCWIIFFVYWFISSWSVKPTQETKWSVSYFRWIIIGLIVASLLADRFGLAAALHLPACILDLQDCGNNLLTNTIPVSPALQVISIFLVIAGLIVAIEARRTLAGNWSSNVELKKGHELITKGIYSYVRHPIYTGVLLMALGTILFFQTIASFIVFLLMCALFVFKFKQEEQLLSKHFPKEYPAYKKRVKALIPFIF